MRRWWPITRGGVRWFLGVIAFIALLLVALVDTAPGLSILAWLITPLTGGQVSIRGLSGDIPNRLHADTVEVRDRKGIWLHVENVALDWSALAVLHSHVSVRRVTAAKLILLRIPEPVQSQGTPPQIDIAKLSIARIEIAQSVVGRPATLTAEGSLHYISLHQLRADLVVMRLNSKDRYRVKGDIQQDVANGAITISEGADGVLAGLIGLPGLGPINLSAHASGDRAANTIAFNLTAAALRASGQGTIALETHRMDIDFYAKAPAMQPRADMAWQSLTLGGHIHGLFAGPDVNAKLVVLDAEAGGSEIARLTADVTGSSGHVDLQGAAVHVRIPGQYPHLFATAPIAIVAHADLEAPTRPITFSLSHPLATISGNADTRGKMAVSMQAVIPSLAPFAALAHGDMAGSATLKVNATQSGQQTTLTLNGHIKTDGTSLIARMLGRNAVLALQATLDGAHVTDSKISLQGVALTANAGGNFRDSRLNYTVSMALTDLSRLTNKLTGDLLLSASIKGPLQTALVRASGSANLASKELGRQHVLIDFQAHGFPLPSSAVIRVNGSLGGSQISANGNLAMANGKIQNAKLTANWKSLNARAYVVLPLAGPITGYANINLKNLSDLASFLGTAITGNVNAAIELKAHGARSVATLHAESKGIGIADAKIGAFVADGTVDNPFDNPSLDLTLTASKIDTHGVSGAATVHVNGSLEKLAVAAYMDLHEGSGNPANITANALLDVPSHRVSLQHVNVIWHNQSIVLKQPALVDFTNGISVDRLAVSAWDGEMELSGRLTPKLAVSISAHGVQMRALQLFLPVTAIGTLSATAQLNGTLAAPDATFTLQGRNLASREYSTQAIAPANLDARGVWRDKTIALTATLEASNSARLTVSGEFPLQVNKGINLQVAGTADLAMLNPILTASGRQVRGALALDANIGGTLAAPRVSGSGQLKDGEWQDFDYGVHISAINATIEAQGNSIRISRFAGRAGPGTVSGSGTIAVSTPGMPIDLSLHVHDARPIDSDRMTAVFSGDLKLTGKLQNSLNLTGNVDVTRGEINLPDKFPPDVAVLDVRRRGQTTPPPPQSTVTVVLDLTMTTSGQIFVRGHGIDANLGGRIHLTGTSNTPFVSGGFDMNHGTLSIAGQTLEFTSGKISFDGSGVKNRIDPTLNFVAQSTSGGVTATLTVGGYASTPKIFLSSSPPLPQDEILAHLLFQQGTKQLTPLQLAEIAQALVSLGGIGSGFDPVGALRKRLGLDRFAVGSTTGGATGTTTQTTVEAGKYVARNVYVGAKQNLSGGSQMQVQVDLTKHLKAIATLSTENNTTVTNGNAAQDNGSNIGLSYQFEY